MSEGCVGRSGWLKTVREASMALTWVPFDEGHGVVPAKLWTPYIQEVVESFDWCGVPSVLRPKFCSRWCRISQRPTLKAVSVCVKRCLVQNGRALYSHLAAMLTAAYKLSTRHGTGGDRLKNYGMDQLRSVALVAHGGTGKTSLAEAMLYASKATKRLGRVDEGNSILDYDPEETRRTITINLSNAPIEWKNQKINVLDTPGYFDFAGDVLASTHVVDAAVLVVCASSGVEVGTEKSWAYAEKEKLPRMIFVNKMERENANFEKVVEDLQEAFGPKVVPFQLPIGNAEEFKGIIDLVRMKSYLWDGQEVRDGEIPENIMDRMERAREAMIEGVATADDELMMKYLEGETLTDEEVRRAAAVGTQTGELVPVFCGSATSMVGIEPFLDYVLRCVPPASQRKIAAVEAKSGEPVEVNASDDSLCALVFKTMADPYVGKLTLFRVFSGVLKSDSSVFNATLDREERVGQLFVVKGKEQIPVDQIGAGDIGAVAKLQEASTNDTFTVKEKPVKLQPIEFPKPLMTMAVEPKAKGDEEKIGSGLTRLAEEDPTFTVKKDPDTAQILISGLGDLHLEVMCSRLQKKFGVEVELSDPIIPYRETIRGKVSMEGKHKKQSGGRGQFGHVFIDLEPGDPDSEERLEFVDKIFGGSVPRQYIPAVEKGIRETMDQGPVAGFPVDAVKVTLTDGSYHAVDSSEMAFKIAASLAFKKAFLEAKPVLLEPIMHVEVRVPDNYMGDVMGDMNKKRGRILGMEPQAGEQVIKAQVPMAEMFRYAIELRSMTQGRGNFSMEFDHYEEVPAQIAEKVIEERKNDD